MSDRRALRRLALSEAVRDAVWPAFDDRWIVYEDEHLLAVDKPEGVSCQAADPEHPDDLVHRLKLHRPGQYVGVHQRLDQDTSGVLVYTKKKEANRGLAQQLEGRKVDKTYVALVAGWRGGDRRLEHALKKGKSGRMEVGRGKRAVTHVKVLERGPITRLELRIETGRTHQIRAQLAHVGAPVLGDTIYDGPPAPRLMLHSRRLALRHPITDARLVLEAPDALTVEHEPLEVRLDRALGRRWGLAHREGLDAFRLVHSMGDGVSGLAVDLYGSHVVLHIYDDDAPVDDALAYLRERFCGVYVKRRPKQANVIVDGRDEAFAPSEPVGEPAPPEAVVHEHGSPLIVRLDEGLSTGLFLDQRHARAWVRAHAGGLRVLNLFCYTGAFTVAAAAGGARETLSVDASGRLLAWAEANLTEAGLVSAETHRFRKADCFEALDALAKGRERFDLVIVDPPTYSTTKASRWTSGKAWRDLGRRCLEVLAPGGRLLASSNDHRMSQARFRKHLHDAARDARVGFAQLKDLPPPRDFPRGPDGSHLKQLLATLA